MIIKLQIPITTTAHEPIALAYPEDRSVHHLIPITTEIKKAMKGRLKAYFRASVTNGVFSIHLDREVPGWE